MAQRTHLSRDATCRDLGNLGPADDLLFGADLRRTAHRSHAFLVRSADGMTDRVSSDRRRDGSLRHRARLVGCAIVLASIAAGEGCTAPEDPARVTLRERLRDERRLTDDELTQVRAVIARAIEGKVVLAREGTEARELKGDERAEVFNMLEHPEGLFDEGLRHESDTTLVRVLNAPGKSNNAEIEASQRLWIDVEALEPRRYLFQYAFPGYGDVAFDLAVQP